jgi:hypothetical protein
VHVQKPYDTMAQEYLHLPYMNLNGGMASCSSGAREIKTCDINMRVCACVNNDPLFMHAKLTAQEIGGHTASPLM